MAKIYVCKRDAYTSPQDTGLKAINLERGWKRGDVAFVLENGQKLGRMLEGRSDIFQVLHLPGIPAARLKRLLSRETPTITEPRGFGHEQTQNVRMRLFSLDLDSFQAMRSQGVSLVEDDIKQLVTEKEPIVPDNIL